MTANYFGISTKLAPLGLFAITGTLIEHEGKMYIVGNEYSRFKGEIVAVNPESVFPVVSYDSDGTAVLSDDNAAKLDEVFLKLRDCIWH